MGDCGDPSGRSFRRFRASDSDFLGSGILAAGPRVSGAIPICALSRQKAEGICNGGLGHYLAIRGAQQSDPRLIVPPPRLRERTVDRTLERSRAGLPGQRPLLNDAQRLRGTEPLPRQLHLARNLFYGGQL